MVLPDTKVAAIIVTHDSGRVLPFCLKALLEQTRRVDRIVIVDSGSPEPSYLYPYAINPAVKILFEKNIGFAVANNLGAAEVPADYDYILLLNPDTFLEPDFIASALSLMSTSPDAGIVTGKMRGYDPVAWRPTGLLDSTGVFQKWYGRWYDRGQGEPDQGQYGEAQYVPAVCGALMFCRGEVLRQAVLQTGHIFDPAFFMYKEDIELCLRLSKKGVKFLYHPMLKAYHCRGWQRDRTRIAYQLRLLSARNEIILNCKHPSIHMAWALVKYLLVRFLRI